MQGITVRDVNQKIVLSSSAGSLFFHSKITADSNELVESGEIAAPDLFKVLFFTYTVTINDPDPPTVFMKAPSNLVNGLNKDAFYVLDSMKNTGTSGGQYAWTIIVSVARYGSSFAMVVADVEPSLYVFCGIQEETPAENYGIVTRNAQGKLLYDSGHIPLSIVETIPNNAPSPANYTLYYDGSGGYGYRHIFYWGNNQSTMTIDWDYALIALPLSENMFVKALNDQSTNTANFVGIFRWWSWAALRQSVGFHWQFPNSITHHFTVRMAWGYHQLAIAYTNPTNPLAGLDAGGIGDILGDALEDVEISVPDLSSEIGDFPDGYANTQGVTSANANYSPPTYPILISDSRFYDS